jgi:predicted acyltransferase
VADAGLDIHQAGTRLPALIDPTAQDEAGVERGAHLLAIEGIDGLSLFVFPILISVNMHISHSIAASSLPGL